MLYKSISGLDMFDICALAIKKLSNYIDSWRQHICPIRRYFKGVGRTCVPLLERFSFSFNDADGVDVVLNKGEKIKS